MYHHTLCISLLLSCFLIQSITAQAIPVAFGKNLEGNALAERVINRGSNASVVLGSADLIFNPNWNPPPSNTSQRFLHSYIQPKSSPAIDQFAYADYFYPGFVHNLENILYAISLSTNLVEIEETPTNVTSLTLYQIQDGAVTPHNLNCPEANLFGNTTILDFGRLDTEVNNMYIYLATPFSSNSQYTQFKVSKNENATYSCSTLSSNSLLKGSYTPDGLWTIGKISGSFVVKYGTSLIWDIDILENSFTDFDAFNDDILVSASTTDILLRKAGEESDFVSDQLFDTPTAYIFQLGKVNTAEQYNSLFANRTSSVNQIITTNSTSASFAYALVQFSSDDGSGIVFTNNKTLTEHFIPSSGGSITYFILQINADFECTSYYLLPTGSTPVYMSYSDSNLRILLNARGEIVVPGLSVPVGEVDTLPILRINPSEFTDINSEPAPAPGPAPAGDSGQTVADTGSQSSIDVITFSPTPTPAPDGSYTVPDDNLNNWMLVVVIIIGFCVFVVFGVGYFIYNKRSKILPTKAPTEVPMHRFSKLEHEFSDE